MDGQIVGLMDRWIDGCVAFTQNSGASSSISFGKVKQKTSTINVKTSYKE